MNQPTTWWALGILALFGVALYQLQVSEPITIESTPKTGESISVAEQPLSEDYHQAYEKMVQGELKELLDDATTMKPRPTGFERSPRVVRQFPSFVPQRTQFNKAR